MSRRLMRDFNNMLKQPQMMMFCASLRYHSALALIIDHDVSSCAQRYQQLIIITFNANIGDLPDNTKTPEKQGF